MIAPAIVEGERKVIKGVGLPVGDGCADKAGN